MHSLQTYPVNELFQTLQGEGHFSGIATIFVRLQGCDVGCPWCDTQHSWKLDLEHEVAASQILNRCNVSSSWAKMSAAEILDAFKQFGYTARHVVITGGEPCLYDLRELSTLFIASGYRVQIETSGTAPILVHPDAWVTVSPKLKMKGGKEVLPDAMARANEIKYPLATERHLEELDELLHFCKLRDDVVIALQPISQKRHATQLAIKTCIERNWRLSVQLHKYLEID